MGLRSLFFILFILHFAIGCASGPKKDGPFFNDQSKYDVLCENPETLRKYSYFLDSTIVGWSSGEISIQNAHGVKSVVSAKTCIFERMMKIKDHPSNLLDSKFYQVVCKIGEAMFMDSNLQIIEANDSLNFMRRVDGHVWLIPKKICPLIEQSPDLGG